MDDMEYEPSRSKLLHAQAVVAQMSYTLINAFVRLASLLLWPRPKPRQPNRIAVFRIGHIGDITCALPAIHALRVAYPDAHLTLITSTGKINSPGAVELLKGADWLDEIYAYTPEEINSLEKRLRLASVLREKRFDLWISLSPNLTSCWRELRDLAFVRLVSPRWARGWSVGTLRLFPQAQSTYIFSQDEVRRNLEVVARAGFNIGAVDFGLPVSLDARSKVASLLAKVQASNHWVAIAPGAKRSTNRWPADRFIEVGRYLVEQGVSVVLIGGQHDAQECEQIAREIGVRAMSLAGQLSLAESCELLRLCDFAICVDSGVQHLASAVGTPCISLFSFWQMRGKWHPYGEKNVVIQKWVPCHTCMLEACPYDNQCMKDISFEEVIQAAEIKLRGQGPDHIVAGTYGQVMDGSS